MTLQKLASKTVDKAKDVLDKLFRSYETTVRARRDLHDAHPKIFAKDRELEKLISSLEEEIKIKVRVQAQGKPSGAIEVFRGSVATVNVTSKWSTKIDADGLLTALPSLRELPGVVKTTIDASALDALIKSGAIDEKTVQPFIKKEQVTAAVSFKSSEVG